MYGNTSTDADLQAIGGKTLAAEILNSFRLVADMKSTPSYPLTLFFGEEDTMMSLFSLMMLDSISSDFKAMPPYGSAMVFELFSTGDNVDVPSDPDDMWVRFSFYNSTKEEAGEEEKEKLTAYPMFAAARSQFEMAWPLFQTSFQAIGINTVGDWCSSCQSASSFCHAPSSSSNPSSSKEQKHGLSPAVAGVIGAIVSLVVTALLFAAAMLLGGIRLHRKRANTQLGGFKGSRKLASDPDLGLAGNAAVFGGHERLGSWELRQKEFAGDDGANLQDNFSFPMKDTQRSGLGVRKMHIRENSLGGAATLRPADAHRRC
jgi:hypothetical protein